MGFLQIRAYFFHTFLWRICADDGEEFEEAQSNLVVCPGDRRRRIEYEQRMSIHSIILE